MISLKILDNLINEVISRYNKNNLDFKIKELAIGSHFSICILHNDYTGLCHSPLTTSQINTFNRKRINDKTIFEILEKHKIDNIRDLNPLDLIKLANSKKEFEKGLGISCINAISQYLLFKNDYKIQSDENKIAGIEFVPRISVGLIGAITPIIRKLEKMNVNRIFLKENDIYKIPKNINNLIITKNLDFLEELDILLITGSSVANDSIDRILKLSKSCKENVLIGPTAGFIPDPFFKEGITRIAGMRIIDSDKTFNVIINGKGTRVFKKYGQKYFIIQAS
ncbi:MAG: hypothetical protein EU549_02395 [Promethearchaeota archaeon]|nr:MAG: hypothetical protein EU549_02395 [Candidatus Lokiarchaeota archaeon]